MKLSDVLGILLVVAIFGGAAVLIIWQTRRSSQARKLLEQRSMDRGWQFLHTGERGAPRYVISGKTNDIRWTIEGGIYRTASQQDNSRPFTRIATEDVKADTPVVILTSAGGLGMLPAGGLGGAITGMVESLIRTYLWALPGAGPGLFTEGQQLTFVQSGGEEFHKSYSILANSESEARSLLNSDVEGLLVEAARLPNSAPKPIVIILSDTGLNVVMIREFIDEASIDQIIMLGTSIARSIKKDF
jgi:hypothetical protein